MTTATRTAIGVVILLLCFYVSVLPTLMVVPSSQASSQDELLTNLPRIELPHKGHPKLGSVLWELLATEEVDAGSFARQRMIELTDGRIRVVIEAEPGETLRAIETAKALGATVEVSCQNLVQVVIPVARLISLADDPNVCFVRLPRYACPPVTSEGLDLVNAPCWHTAGYTGIGVKVAILDVGFADYEARMGIELPASMVTHWAPSQGGPGASEHGTKTAEVIYDIAPNAQFYLVNFGTMAEWIDAIDYLINQDVDVVATFGSAAWGPGDGTGMACNALDFAASQGIYCSIAAHNFAESHWAGFWRDDNWNNWHNFGTLDETNTVYLSEGDSITAVLRWDDPWGASSNDYDLYLYDSYPTNVVASSTNVQDGNDEPVEVLWYMPSWSGTYHLAIWEFNSSRPVDLDLFVYRETLQYQVAAGSICVPADSATAGAVGAVAWYSPNILKSYSGQGPTEDGRTKPDIVAPTDTSTSFGAFGGTSCANPHAAGAAVLVKDRYPSYTPAKIKAFLEERAIDLGTDGKDNLYGSGRLNLGEATSPPTVPTVVTSEATTIEATTATLNGMITNDGGEFCQYRFEYDTDSGDPYAQHTEWADGKVTGDAFTETIVGLAQDTTYYFRAQAQNSGGVGSGEELSFTSPKLFSVTIGASPDDITLTIDGTPYSADQLPMEFSWVDGSVHQCVAPSPVEVDKTTQYVFVEWSDSDIEPASREITVSEDATYTANYKTQHYLTVESDYGEPSGGGWYDEGASAGIGTEETIGDDETRYVFLNWLVDAEEEEADNNTSIVMDSPHTAVAEYKTQHYLTVTSDYGEPTGEDWYDEGSAAEVETEDVITGKQTRHVFQNWVVEGEDETDNPLSLTVDSPLMASAEYKTQHYLTVNSEYGDPTGESWYDEGETATASVTSPVGSIVRKVFTEWSGDSTAASPATTVLMDEPKSVTANWRDDYLYLYVSIGGVILVVGGGLALAIWAGRNKKPRSHRRNL